MTIGYVSLFIVLSQEAGFMECTIVTAPFLSLIQLMKIILAFIHLLMSHPICHNSLRQYIIYCNIITVYIYDNIH